jgi:outer membrane protein TolC
MMPQRLFFWFTLFLNSYTCYAQRLSLEDAVALSLAQYPTLSAQQAALNASKANLELVKDNRLPNLRLHNQVHLGTANGLPGSYFSMGLIVPTSGSIRPNNSMEMATGNIALAFLDWEVYNFGRYQAEQQVARGGIQVSEAEMERERFLLQQTVINTYLDALRLRQIAGIEEKNVARAETVLKIIANLVRSGIKPGLDTSLAVAEVSKAKLGYLQVQEQYMQAKINLATLTGVPLAQLRIDTTFHPERLMIVSDQSTNEAPHPLLRFRERTVARQALEVEVLQKAAMPRLSILGATWMRGSNLDFADNYGPLASGLVYRRYNFLLGVAITFNVTDIRRARRRTDVQQFRVEEARQQLASESLQLQNTFTSSDSLLILIRKQLREIPTAVRAATDVYNQRMTLYNNGLENIIGLTDALKLLYNVEKDYITARNKAAQLMLQRAFATNDYEAFYNLFRS